MNTDLIKLQNVLRENNILISFSGTFYQGIIEELGEAIKNHLETEETQKSSVYNVFSIFIEQSQNIRNYTISKKDSGSFSAITNSGIISIGKSNNQFFVYSGNLIENSDIEPLATKLSSIQKMNKDELKKFYRAEIKKEQSSNSIGAGVGLIDIARKASLPLEFTIEKIDENFSFFQLKTVV